MEPHAHTDTLLIHFLSVAQIAHDDDRNQEQHQALWPAEGRPALLAIRCPVPRPGSIRRGTIERRYISRPRCAEGEKEREMPESSRRPLGFFFYDREKKKRIEMSAVGGGNLARAIDSSRVVFFFSPFFSSSLHSLFPGKGERPLTPIPCPPFNVTRDGQLYGTRVGWCPPSFAVCLAVNSLGSFAKKDISF